MNPKRKRRLWVLFLLVLSMSTATGLCLYALSRNINLFYSPTQVALNQAPVNRIFRLGGMVVPGSVLRDPNTLQVQFNLTDFVNTVTVVHIGILPDLFREGQGIVAQGAISSTGVFTATEVLAKHDENYMPPEVAKSLKR